LNEILQYGYDISQGIIRSEEEKFFSEIKFATSGPSYPRTYGFRSGFLRLSSIILPSLRLLDCHLVFLWLWPQAKKPTRLFGFSTKAIARPKLWPGLAFVLAWQFLRPKPEITLDALVKAIACWLSGQSQAWLWLGFWPGLRFSAAKARPSRGKM
jgi:hypothetical protein